MQDVGVTCIEDRPGRWQIPNVERRKSDQVSLRATRRRGITLTHRVKNPRLPTLAPSVKHDGKRRRAIHASALQMSGEAPSRIHYRARFEEYGADYRPAGSSVTPDRRTLEGHAGYRFNTGLTLDGRVQSFRSALESANPVDTDVIGANLAGPLKCAWLRDLSMSLGAFIQDVQSRDRSSDAQTRTVDSSLSAQLGRGWSGRTGLFLQTVDDHAPGRAMVTTRQLLLGADHAVSMFGLRGSVAPALTLREIAQGPGTNRETNPTVGLNLNRGGQALSATVGWLGQDRVEPGQADVRTFTAALSWAAPWKTRTVGIEANYQDQSFSPGTSTQAYQTAVFCRIPFEKEAEVRADAGAQVMTAPEADESVRRPAGGRLDLVRDLPLGQTVEQARDALVRAGHGAGVQLGSTIIQDLRLFDEFPQRQRLAVRHEAGRVTRVGMVLDPEHTGSPDTVIQLYERLRQRVGATYGRPARSFDAGQPGPNLVADINANRLTRISEWDTPEGVLRLGIPRRLDGRLRVELQHAKAFPPPRQPLWSLEEVR